MLETAPIYRTAIAGQCPRCGKGPLFTRILALRETCSQCRLDYRFIDTGDGPAVFAIFILGALVLGMALWVEFRYEPPLWVHAILWGLMLPLIATGLLRVLKATLIALQYRHGAEEARVKNRT